MQNKENAEYIGKTLIEAGLLNQNQFDMAMEEFSLRDKFIFSIAKGLGFCEEKIMLAAVSKKLDIPFISLKETEIPQTALKKLPARFASHYKIIPVALDEGVLTLAVADPLNVHTLDDISSLLDVEVRPVLASEEELEESIRTYYGVGADTLDKIIYQAPPQVKPEATQTEDVTVSKDEETSIITFVNQILSEAVKMRATDIHLEPFEDGLRARFRVDGVLSKINVPESINYFYPSIVSRIKIMANLNIAEKRLPQDGRIKIRVGESELDLRVSIIPTTFAEAVHIRILSPYFFLELENLGLLEDDRTLIEQVVLKPHGIILVTGPTGSGKSTTLYACLSRINSPAVKIVTIEDPVEYQLKGVIQIQVLPSIGLPFARGLRAMLRHDPDVMMVGEIRDFETAEIAIRAALTGHLVFSTLHTNDAASSVTRLLDMGIEPFLLASSLECLIAQRLVRIICARCKEQIAVSADTRALLQEAGLEDNRTIFEGTGCQECRQTGYKGRTGVYEIMRLSEPVRELILQHASSQKIKQQAVNGGMRTLLEDGLRKATMGITTVNEVLRVTQEEEL